jgi:tRNA dimethylallyltransferase
MPDPSLPPAVFLMGPTASGKTTQAVALVRTFPLEIISVDSALVYRGMDIGTAKPDADTLHAAPHALIDIRDPAVPYSAADFRNDARAEMARITAAGRIPLLVGGTFLYFRALQQGLSELPAADPVIRARLEAEATAHGLPALHRRLQQLDPATAARLHQSDLQRIQRALEVIELTGRPLSELHARGRGDALPYRVLKLALYPEDRAWLHRRIDARLERMLTAGFEAEVRSLAARGDLSPELPALRAVGYRQMWAWLAGESEYRQMVEQIRAATRQYARRQLTWLRGEPGLECFDCAADDLTEQLRGRLDEWLV